MIPTALRFLQIFKARAACVQRSAIAVVGFAWLWSIGEYELIQIMKSTAPTPTGGDGVGAEIWEGNLS